MRNHIKPLMGAACFIIAIALMASTSCSWEIFTQGEINKEDIEIAEILEKVPGPVLEILEILPGRDDIPDSVRFKVTSWLWYDSYEVFFVEMEVGELLEGQGADPDTIVTDHRP